MYTPGTAGGALRFVEGSVGLYQTTILHSKRNVYTW